MPPRPRISAKISAVESLKSSSRSSGERKNSRSLDASSHSVSPRSSMRRLIRGDARLELRVAFEHEGKEHGVPVNQASSGISFPFLPNRVFGTAEFLVKLLKDSFHLEQPFDTSRKPLG